MTCRLLRAACTLLAVAAFSSGARAGERPRIAVLDVQITDIDAQYVGLLTEILTVEVAKLNRFEVISGSDIQAMLGFESQRDLISCDDASCISEIGGALGVNFIMVGHVGRLGGSFVVNIKLIDIGKARPAGRVYETVRGEMDVLVDTIRSSLGKLLAESTGLGEEATPTQGSPVSTSPVSTSPVPTATKEGPLLGVGVFPLVLWSVSAVSLALTIAFGVEAQAHAANANDPNFVGAWNEIEIAQTDQILTNVLLGTAIASAAGGFALWLLTGDESENGSVAISPVVGPTQVGLRLGATF